MACFIIFKQILHGARVQYISESTIDIPCVAAWIIAFCSAWIDLQEEYKSKKFLIRSVEQYQTKITNWFNQNFFLKVTAEYTENDTVIVKIVRHTRDNKFYSLTFLAEEFKKYFKKEVWIEP